jgi:hypothetical protein
LCNGNVEVKEHITYLPIYLVMFIQPKDSGVGVYQIDLSGLV